MLIINKKYKLDILLNYDFVRPLGEEEIYYLDCEIKDFIDLEEPSFAIIINPYNVDCDEREVFISYSKQIVKTQEEIWDTTDNLDEGWGIFLDDLAAIPKQFFDLIKDGILIWEE